jgi:hypothetical protein
VDIDGPGGLDEKRGECGGSGHLMVHVNSSVFRLANEHIDFLADKCSIARHHCSRKFEVPRREGWGSEKRQ